MIGDRANENGFILTGKPPRGLGRLFEYFQNKRIVRRTRVNEGLEQHFQTIKPDLIWFHNLAGGAKWGWSEKMISIARHFAPVLWTLHDMWALGDDDQSYWEVGSGVESGKLKGGVQSGPKVQSGEGEKAGSRKNSRVSKVFREGGKHPVMLTAPSRWLAKLTTEKTGEECRLLPNPIDLGIFSPGDRAAARRRWGLPEKGLVVLAGADSLADPRKGFDLLRQAWEPGRVHGATLALFGRHGEHRPQERYLGNLTSDEEMAAAYRAADLYVHPARMDNAPCTIQESLACGCPVLAFAVGGIPEMVRHNKTGFLVKQISQESLGRVLQEILRNRARLVKMASACRSYAEGDYDPIMQLFRFRKASSAILQ